ncbi:MAG: 3-keto-disaccharide hydrolase [Pirellulaceae bacterium]
MTSPATPANALQPGTMSTPAIANNVPPAGFTALFNGNGLEGWYGQRDINPHELWELPDDEREQMRDEDEENMRQHWRVENGEIVNDGAGVFLSTESHYRDFEFWIDYKTVADADSGIYLKAAPQVQIWDYTEAGGKWGIGADKGSGGLWNNSAGSPGKDPSVLADRPFGEWNRFRIRQIGQRTSVWLNDKLVIDHAIMENNHWKKGHPLAAAGPIWLQTHGGEIRWRNVFIREIPVDEANRILAERANRGADPIFDGQTFAGWAGPTDNYEIVDGAVRCKPEKGGTIYTEQEYDDFSVHFEFKLPPGGNNGLAIRYPGEGDTAYVGMCELQVLDNTADQFATLDPRQYHGSAYGMVASHRGYLRETGEWNFQQVTVRGSQIKVELNGSVILDSDLSSVTDYMGDQPHPGKDRTSGHFGFAGHSSPVTFRNIAIRRLGNQ